eukprot:762009-Lingulodinium_polyedra.AAC.1
MVEPSQLLVVNAGLPWASWTTSENALRITSLPASHPIASSRAPPGDRHADARLNARTLAIPSPL